MKFSVTDDSLAGELYISDEEDFAPPKHISVPKSVLPQTSDTKMEYVLGYLSLSGLLCRCFLEALKRLNRFSSHKKKK